MKFKEALKNIVIIGLLVILLIVSYSKFIEKEYPIKLLGMSFLIVTTGSMEPEINAGELIVIREKENYEVGDIVTFLDNDDFLITHRIVEIDENVMKTKGDANNLFDEQEKIENIKGEVIFHSKILGFFVLYLLKPLIFIYVTTIIIINLINTFFIEKEREKYDDEIESNVDN